MNNILAQICDDKRQHIAAQKQLQSEAQLVAQAKHIAAPRGFKRALETRITQQQTAIIAEVKKASPSKGIIRADFDPVTIARAYENAGASCISVLTDQPYFQGEDAYLQAIAKAVSLPLLRKDFMLDPYQIIESRALGADAILLIMAALDDGQARALYDAATELGMDVLIEIHAEDELDRALTLGDTLIGINNRNLKTLAVDLATSEALIARIPDHITTICESGIYSKADITRMHQSGMYGFLIGESLMRQDDVETALRALL